MASYLRHNSLSLRCTIIIDRLQQASAIKLWRITGVLPSKINQALRHNIKSGTLVIDNGQYRVTQQGRELLFSRLLGVL